MHLQVSSAPAAADGLFNDFYEATSCLAFDLASDLVASPNDAARIVATAYERSYRAVGSGAGRYHVIPLLHDIYETARHCPNSHGPRNRPQIRPGTEAVSALAEPHRTLLYLTERDRFSVVDAGVIVGLQAADAQRVHEEGRIVAHGTSAALALFDDGNPQCVQLAGHVDPTQAGLAQVPTILSHAGQCRHCTSIAMASPDPVRELRQSRLGTRRVALPPAPPTPEPEPPAAGLPRPVPAVLVPARAVHAAPAPLESAPPPTPTPALAELEESGRNRRDLWGRTSGWQRGGIAAGILLVVATVAALAFGSTRPGEDRSVPAGSGRDPVAAPAPGPLTTVAPDAAPAETAPPPAVETTPSTTSATTTEAPVPAVPATVPPDPTTAPTTAPQQPVATNPSIHNAQWGVVATGIDPESQTLLYAVTFSWSSDGTASAFTTSWGDAGDVPAGSSQRKFENLGSGTHSLTLTVTGPGGATSTTYDLTLP